MDSDWINSFIWFLLKIAVAIQYVYRLKSGLFVSGLLCWPSRFFSE